MGVPVQRKEEKKEEPKKEEKKPEPKKEEAKPPQPGEPLTPEKKEALDEKEKGNEAYKKKDFGTAIGHYKRAIELDPENMTYYTNAAGKSSHWIFTVYT